MQHSPQVIKDTLLEALDRDYNVINMPVVVEVIGILEKTSITKEALESTRLGKYINELRRKTTNENVAKRAKELVKKWRDMIVPEKATGGNGIRTIQKGQLSPGLSLRRSQPASPATRVSSLSPETKLPSPAISPRLHPYSPKPAPLDNGIPPVPRGRGRPPNSSYASAQSASTPQPSPPPPAPRQRGRPPKNKNKHKRPSSDLVPKTSPANKRLRKSSPEPVRVNGICAGEVPTDSVSRTPKVKTTRELLQSIQQESSLDMLRNKTLTSLGVARPSEKSSPKSASSVRPSPSPVPSPSSRQTDAQKFLSRLPVKRPMPAATVTAAAASVVAPPRPATPPSPTGSDIVDVEKVSGCEDSPVKPPAPPVVTRAETVEEILARLPPVNPDEIIWTDDEDEDVEPKLLEVTSEDVQRLLECHVEGLNGNHTDGESATQPGAEPHGLQVPLSAEHGATQPPCPSDCPFREWHETLSKTSYQGELLHILPYVIID